MDEIEERKWVVRARETFVSIIVKLDTNGRGCSVYRIRGLDVFGRGLSFRSFRPSVRPSVGPFVVNINQRVWICKLFTLIELPCKINKFVPFIGFCLFIQDGSHTRDAFTFVRVTFDMLIMKLILFLDGVLMYFRNDLSFVCMYV